jgi:hypothetical protein
MNMINIDGRHIIEQNKHAKFDSRMRAAFLIAALALTGYVANLYNNHLSLPEKAVCADTVSHQKSDDRYSAYYVECHR